MCTCCTCEKGEKQVADHLSTPTASPEQVARRNVESVLPASDLHLTHTHTHPPIMQALQMCWTPGQRHALRP